MPKKKTGLGLKRAERITVQTSAGELHLRPLNALDISDLVEEFDLETVELATKLINHHQSGRSMNELFTDASLWADLVHTLPALIASAITLCAGGDDEDHEAIRELPADEFSLLTAKMVSHSLKRIGGLGNLLDLAREATSKVRETFENELRKKQGSISSKESGETSHS